MHENLPEDSFISENLLKSLKRLIDFCLETHYPEEYIKYAEEYLKFCSEEKDFPLSDSIAAEIYSGLSQFTALLERTDEAKEWMKKAKIASRRAKRSERNADSNPGLGDASRALAYYGLAESEIRKQSYESALDYLKEETDVVAEALKNGNLDSRSIGEFKVLNMLAMCSKARIYGFIGDHKEKRRLLETNQDELLSCFNSYHKVPQLSEMANLLLLTYVKLYIESLCKDGDFDKALNLFASYIGDFERLRTIKDSIPMLFKVLNLDLQELRLDTSLSYSEDLSSENDLRGVYQFIRENLREIEKFDKLTPGIVDQEKLNLLRERCALLRGRLRSSSD